MCDGASWVRSATPAGVRTSGHHVPARVAGVAGVELAARRDDEPRVALGIIGAHRRLNWLDGPVEHGIWCVAPPDDPNET
jgi:hypothetical protein